MNRFGIELGKLMENHLLDILFNERANCNCIHLYRAAEYWVAFGRSAFNLCCSYAKSVINAMKVFKVPFPIVVASVEEREIPFIVGSMKCTKKTSVERIYKIAKPSDSLLFQEWHYQNTLAFHNRGLAKPLNKKN